MGYETTGILDPFDKPAHYHNTADEQEINSYLDIRMDESTSHRRGFDEEVEYNRAILRGDRIIARNVDTDEVVYLSLSEDARRKWFRFSSENIIRNVNRALVGKHCRIIPGVRAIPASADEEDVRASDICTGLLEYFMRAQNLRYKYVKAHRYLGWAGTALFKLDWDKQAGRQLGYCSQCEMGYDEELIGMECPSCAEENAQAAKQEHMQGMMQAVQEVPMGADPAMADQMVEQIPQVEPEPAPILQKIFEGDISVTVRDPRDFYPEPGVEEICDMRYCCWRTPVSLSECAERWPEMSKYLQPEEDVNWERTSLEHTAGSSATPSDYLFLEEWHERPSEGNPQGRLIYRANGVILNRSIGPDGEEVLGEPHPLWFLNQLPAFAFRWERLEGVFWGESHITQSRWIQRERNDLLRQNREQREITNKPILLSPLGSLVSKDDFYNAGPGQVLKYNSMSGKPNFLPAPEFPIYVYQELDRKAQAIQEAASVTPHEMGQAPSDQSGRFAAILEAQSSETIRGIIVENTQAWLELHRAMLMVAKKMYLPERTWTVWSKDGWWTYDWASVDLKEGWDVAMQEVDSLSQNPALRLEQAERLLMNGYFTNPQTGVPDMARFGRMAGLQDAVGAPDTDADMRAWAVAIPDMLQEGSWTGPQMWDDARICAEELAAWLRGVGRHQSPEVQQQVGQVWALYAQAAAGMGAQLQAQPNQMLQTQQPQNQTGGPMEQGGQQPVGQQGTPSQEASQIVSQADQAGEALSRSGPHES